jgi:hypothetical protein
MNKATLGLAVAAMLCLLGTTGAATYDFEETTQNGTATDPDGRTVPNYDWFPDSNSNWDKDDDGSESTDGVPNAAGDEAVFDSNIGGNGVMVTMNNGGADVTIGILRMADNADRWTIRADTTERLVFDNGSEALIDVDCEARNEQPAITADVVLNDNLRIEAGLDEADGDATMQFYGSISGPGKSITLQNYENKESAIFFAANDYGDTVIEKGGLFVTEVGGLGSGTVDIQSGAWLALRDDDVDDAVIEQVTGLVLGGIVQTALGTYGSTDSNADFQDDTFFVSSKGDFDDVIELVAEPAAAIPEPVSALGVILGVGALGRYLRRRRR